MRGASPGDWVPYADAHPGSAHTVVGDVRVLPQVGSHGLGPRDVLVLLPASYDPSSDHRYPVLYLHDGQNVFDAATSYVGEWCVDEAVAEAAAAGAGELVVVAVENGRDRRFSEYGPWPDERYTGTGEGDRYLDLLAETVRPAAEAAFPVRTDRDGVGIAGSSMGGLISLYAALERPAEYGWCGAFSPALFFGGGRAFEHAAARAGPAHVVHLDVGGQERLPTDEVLPDGTPPYVRDVRRMRDLLVAAGATVRYVEDPTAGHDEPAWRARFPGALRWFLERSR